jgi:hypothetical protein
MADIVCSVVTVAEKLVEANDIERGIFLFRSLTTNPEVALESHQRACILLRMAELFLEYTVMIDLAEECILDAKRSAALGGVDIPVHLRILQICCVILVNKKDYVSVSNIAKEGLLIASSKQMNDPNCPYDHWFRLCWLQCCVQLRQFGQVTSVVSSHSKDHRDDDDFGRLYDAIACHCSMIENELDSAVLKKLQDICPKVSGTTGTPWSLACQTYICLLELLTCNYYGLDAKSPLEKLSMLLDSQKPATWTYPPSLIFLALGFGSLSQGLTKDCHFSWESASQYLQDDDGIIQFAVICCQVQCNATLGRLVEAGQALSHALMLLPSFSSIHQRQVLWSYAVALAVWMAACGEWKSAQEGWEAAAQLAGSDTQQLLALSLAGIFCLREGGEIDAMESSWGKAKEIQLRAHSLTRKVLKIVPHGQTHTALAALLDASLQAARGMYDNALQILGTLQNSQPAPSLQAYIKSLELSWQGKQPGAVDGTHRSWEAVFHLADEMCHPVTMLYVQIQMGKSSNGPLLTELWNLRQKELQRASDLLGDAERFWRPLREK